MYYIGILGTTYTYVVHRYFVKILHYSQIFGYQILNVILTELD